MITESAKEVMIVIYAPARVSDASLNLAMTRLKERLTQYASASDVRTVICAA
jgi:DNA/RNA-binding domain of Phe-tRNA-synthetase-like protein